MKSEKMNLKEYINNNIEKWKEKGEQIILVDVEKECKEYINKT